MISVEQALERVLAAARPLPTREVAIAEALGAVLAETIESDIDSPPHDKAVVDGYAVRAEDLVAGRRELAVVEEVFAGGVPCRAVAAGQATRIMTGAPLPDGTDAVVMVEKTTHDMAGGALGTVRIEQVDVRSGQNIMRRAKSLKVGQVVIAPPARIGPAEIGLLAEVGRSRVKVGGRPRVAVIATGNELVAGIEKPAAGQIRNSNGPMLVAAARQAGAEAYDLGIARDTREDLERAISAGLDSDLLVLSGGVSAGMLDLVPGVLASLSVRQILHKVDLKPGKPLWVGICERAGSNEPAGTARSEPAGTARSPFPTGPTLVFGLPGNPVSSFVCYELFARPALRKLAGETVCSPIAIPAKLAGDHRQRGDRPTYHPAVCRYEQSGPVVTLLRWEGSGDLRALHGANALALFAAGEREYRAGENVPTILI